MRKSEIKFTIELDQENIPDTITWEATEKPGDSISHTKSISVSLWDDLQKNTMRIDLWTKDMPVDEMKRFYVDCLGGMAQSVLNSTGDEFMASQMNDLCDKLVEHLKKEAEQGGNP
ncbi:MAG: gliding motility protein GldC [Cytophagales bacterium]|nr:gliding motility protein GldC [Cytophagales bacterium]